LEEFFWNLGVGAFEVSCLVAWWYEECIFEGITTTKLWVGLLIGMEPSNFLMEDRYISAL
jgi:hypothetical protein